VQNFIKPIEKYRKKALNFLPHRCNNEKCIIQKNNIKLETYLLDVDHLDKNRANNQLENLQFLCLYCHALKTRLIDSKKRKNKKNGGVSEN